jgi:hypothetical protein
MRLSLFLTLVFTLSVACSTLAQTTEKCSIVSVAGTAKEVDAGSQIVFIAHLTSNVSIEDKKPEFKWKLSAGTIVSGEGSSSITVDTAGLRGQTITATVEVADVPTACLTSASYTVEVKLPGIVCGLPLDTYGDIRFTDEKARLDNFAIHLLNSPKALGYIIAYAGKQTFQHEAAYRLRRAKNYLVAVRRIDPAQVFTLDGGYQPVFFVRLIIVPPGATPPVVSPNEGISRGEIELTKPRPRSIKKRRT